MQWLCSAWQYVELAYDPVEAYWWQPNYPTPKAPDDPITYVHIIYTSYAPDYPPNVYLVLCGTVPLLPAMQGESLPSLVQRSLDETGIDVDDNGECLVRIGPWRGDRKTVQPGYYAILDGHSRIRSWVRKHFIT